MQSEDGSDLGIYVKSVAQGGGASQARWLGHESSTEESPQPVIAPGDRILAVDGNETRGLSQDAAARLVSQAGSEVRLTLARNLGLGCVAAAVPAKDLRKRNENSLMRTVLRETNIPLSCPEFEDILEQSMMYFRVRPGAINWGQSVRWLHADDDDDDDDDYSD
ncbi:unnamed protein product [Rodentolepis nana]|uniref:PDZ domain-containing protein n=1 Tax=Rodentolepis nana TaxID=102285 RepID=A0A0R3TKH7_RODNA|nr:unnamed protein product [Rodentolepis nana]